MRQIKFIVNAFLLAIILFLPVPSVLGNEVDCPGCGGAILDLEGCCETENACTAPTSKAACEVMGGQFYSGIMVCATETKCEKSTAIRLTSFNISQGEAQNLISWSTGAEIDTEGFHILRSTTPDGQFSRVTPSIIASTGSGFSGGRYSFVDTSMEDGKSYYYKLEEVDAYGKMAQYGPVAAEDRNKKLEVRSQITEDEKSEVRSQISEDNGQRTPPPYPSPLKGEGEVENLERSTYTIVAYADGPVKFLSGEAVDDEKVAGIIREQADEEKLEARSKKQEVSSQMSEARSEKQEERNKKKEERSQKQEVRDQGNIQSPETIQFRIIDAEGNEVAIASINQSAVNSEQSADQKTEARSKKLDEEYQVPLQSKIYTDRIVLTWYASEPVKGFHILRSAKKDGEYQKITKTAIPYLNTGQKGKLFKYNYVDAKVEKGKEYYYKIEIISNMENKTAMKM